jgi:hypothetical protein
MGQYWLSVNLTRGRYAHGGAAKLAELASGKHPRASYLPRLVAALRPGGLWSGHRVLLTGDYDDDRRGRVDAYLAVHGLMKKKQTSEEDEERAAARATSCLYSLLWSGPLSGTNDEYKLGWDHDQMMALLSLNTTPADKAAPMEVAVSHDAAQRLTPHSHAAHVTLMCLLAESSGGGGGDVEVSFRGAWAGHRVEVLPADAADARYADVTAMTVKEVQHAMEDW